MFGPRDLKDVVDFTNFDFDNYRESERTVLQPQIEGLGYENCQWYEEATPDGKDVRRVCRALGGKTHSVIGGEGKAFFFYYG